jgi:hypothetical protein
MRGSFSALALLLLAAATTTTPGCKKTLHWRVIEDELQLKLGRDAAIDAASCDESEVKKGERFACHLAFHDGGASDVHVELVDQQGSWRLVETYVSALHASAMIRDKLREHDTIEASIDCGKGLLFTGHHDCAVRTPAGDTGTLDFELTADGDARWKPK